MARDPEATCPFCEHFVDWHDGRWLPENRYRCTCGCVVSLDAEGALVHERPPASGGSAAHGYAGFKWTARRAALRACRRLTNPMEGAERWTYDTEEQA